MELLPGDYAILALAFAFGLTGFFRGLSGTLAFFVSLAAAIVTGFVAWPLSANWTQAVWMRGVGVLVLTLLVFGLIRIVIKKLVNKLLSQPSDSLFGLLVGVALAALVAVGWTYSGFCLEYSNVVQKVAAYVR